VAKSHAQEELARKPCAKRGPRGSSSSRPPRSPSANCCGLTARSGSARDGSLSHLQTRTGNLTRRSAATRLPSLTLLLKVLDQHFHLLDLPPLGLDDLVGQRAGARIFDVGSLTGEDGDRVV